MVVDDIHRDNWNRRAARVPLDEGLGRIKISIPSFSGFGDPEDYLEWELDHSLTACYKDDDLSSDDDTEQKNGLSMLAHAVQQDISNVDAKGQHCNIFQSV
uniref:Uncharacterized protein n=1 Tax=Oryza punctata TaxID=4537 RepID=A0A0E0LBH0_ORYPU